MSEKKKYYFNIIQTTSSPQNGFPSRGVRFSKPLGKNSINLLSVLYEDRDYYANFILPYVKAVFSMENIVGNLLQENALYGLVDEDLNAIYPKKEFLKNIPSAIQEPVQVMDFVADAFNQLNVYLNMLVMTGKMSKTSIFYNLKAHRGYKPPEFFLNLVENKFRDSFINSLVKNLQLSSKVKDAKIFNKYFISFLNSEFKKSYPMTKTATIFSSNFSSFMSGLIIDIKKDKADNDTTKFDKYFSDKDFKCFVDGCRRFGFKIDANVPWRIIADLNSPAMTWPVVPDRHVGYLTRYNIQNRKSLFETRYEKAIYDELDYLKNFFYNVYSSFVEEYPNYELDYNNLTICDFKKQTVFPRKTYTKQEYFDTFPDTYWLRLYIFLRNGEERRNLKQQEFENLVREANNFVIAGRKDKALEFVNEYFKQFKHVAYFSSLQDEKKIVHTIAQSSMSYDLIF